MIIVSLIIIGVLCFDLFYEQLGQLGLLNNLCKFIDLTFNLRTARYVEALWSKYPHLNRKYYDCSNHSGKWLSIIRLYGLSEQEIQYKLTSSLQICANRW